MIKALAYGTAILALNTRFNREMLQNGKYGVFFEKNIESVTKCINYAEQNEQEIDKLKKTSIKGITQKYDWDFIVDKYILEFKNILS